MLGQIITALPSMMPVLRVVESAGDADPKPLVNEATEYFGRILEILSIPPI